MLVGFSFANFRSFRAAQEFSLEVENDKYNLEPTFEVTTSDGKKTRLLNAAIIYGANASGKSNFIRALFTLRKLVVYSGKFQVGEKIEDYEPFKFDGGSSAKPTFFQIEFITGKAKTRYRYQVEYNGEEIVRETLDYFPKGQPANLFTRSNEMVDEEGFHVVKTPPDNLRDQRGMKKIVLKNQLFLSKFGSDPHPQLTPIFKYFKDMDIWNVSEQNRVNFLKSSLTKELKLAENEPLRRRLGRLVRIADTKIEDIFIREASEEDFKFPDTFPDNLKRKIIEDNKDRVFAQHKIYENGAAVGEIEQSMDEESAGTNILYALGGLILKKLEQGGLIVFDELDNSLHPKLARFLIKLFNHPPTNQQNAQIICASHEVLLLDKELFRKDQIWITDKNKYGVSEMTRVSDFEGVREDIPFDKWYMAGKFGGQPTIKELEFMLDHA